jgi:uncharacterized protein YdiU (UPF0061 family)
VLLRLSHGHIRIGTFQRLRAFEQTEHMALLVDYCLDQFPGPPPPADAPGRDEPAVILLHQVVERLADLAASYMVAGFVHGVVNSDNMNVSGESFDYGPWRWLPRWDPRFTAAYFDHSGLYAFGRQPEAILWNCGQLAIALRMLAETEPLVFALERFGGLYQQAMARRFCWRLGIEPRGLQAEMDLVTASERYMTENEMGPDAMFFRHRGGRDAPVGEFGDLLRQYRSAGDDSHPLWQEEAPPTLVIDEVERIWTAIAEHDDWAPLAEKVSAVRRLGDALGEAPMAAGHK